MPSAVLVPSHSIDGLRNAALSRNADAPAVARDVVPEDDPARLAGLDHMVGILAVCGGVVIVSVCGTGDAARVNGSRIRDKIISVGRDRWRDHRGVAVVTAIPRLIAIINPRRIIAGNQHSGG